MLLAKGYEATSVRELADEMGITGARNQNPRRANDSGTGGNLSMKYILAIAWLLLATLCPAAAQDAGPNVRVRLVAEDSAVAPGGTVAVALAQDIRPGWHTYWINPGDAGAATEMKWSLPPGWSATPIRWQTPKRLPVGPLMDYGYEGRPWLLQQLKVPDDAKPGDTIVLKVAVDWLACKDACVPEDAILNLPLKIGDTTLDPNVASDFALARSLLPVTSPWKVTYALGTTLDIYAAAPALAEAHPVEVVFFPEESNILDGDAQQKPDFTKDGLILRLKLASKTTKIAGPLVGVLVLKSSDGSTQALNVSASSRPMPDAAGSSGQVDAGIPAGVTLLVAILSAFVGGLILNAMPCVLPILAMKALALVGHNGRRQGEASREGLAYSAGAILSFLAFGLMIVLLRQGGAAVGWGFQLQNPIAVAGFALLIFAVGLNLSGVFEVGSIALGGSLANRGGSLGAFFTGVLAVAVAAPCTAPFMAAALGFALTAKPRRGDADISEPRHWFRTAIPDFGPLAARIGIPSQAGHMDGAAEAVSRLSDVRRGGMACMGIGSASRSQWRGRVADRHGRLVLGGMAVERNARSICSLAGRGSGGRIRHSDCHTLWANNHFGRDRIAIRQRGY